LVAVLAPPARQQQEQQRTHQVADADAGPRVNRSLGPMQQPAASGRQRQRGQADADENPFPAAHGHRWSSSSFFAFFARARKTMPRVKNAMPTPMKAG